MKYSTDQEAIEAAEADGWVDEFDGMNCNDYLDEDEPQCLGWDGISRRCDCGNRRVYWASYKDDDGNFTVRAEAY